MDNMLLMQWLLFIGAVGYTVWAIRPEWMLLRGNIAKGLALLEKRGKRERISNYIKNPGRLSLVERRTDYMYVDLYLYRKAGVRVVGQNVYSTWTSSPALLNDRPRVLIIVAAEYLLDLKQNVRDINPYVPEHIKTSLQQDLNCAFDVLWDSCQRLSIVARQNVDPLSIEQGIRQQCATLAEIISMASSANAEFSNLTLDGDAKRPRLTKENVDFFAAFHQDVENLLTARSGSPLV